ncbi:glycosyltransferase family 9 protein [Pyrinomonas sp.]|uniref:glycosyltransferase family 9 protein n=1 Tax=Pyrinomonas sp. TaxID=2080306 RepID=UPI003326F99E
MKPVSALYAAQYRARQWIVGKWCSLCRFQKTEPSLQEMPKKVLLVLTGLLGDSVMCTPVIVEARRLWPEARITLLGRRRNVELLAACPYLDDILEAEAIPFTLRQRRELAVLADELRRREFDLAIILLGDQFAHLFAKIGIPIRVGVKEHPLAPCLTHCYSIGSPRSWGPKERLGALRCLGHEVKAVSPTLWVADEARRSAVEKIHALGLYEGDRYVVMHPFGSEKRQWWPLDRAALLARTLFHERGVRTLLIGGPEVRSAVRQDLPPYLLDSTGRLSVKELLAVIERAELVVTTDSGPFHIAGALHKPIIGLFRARRPEHAAAYPMARVVFGRDAECEAECDWDRCKEIPCRQMLSITVQEVLKVINHEEPTASDRLRTG